MEPETDQKEEVLNGIKNGYLLKDILEFEKSSCWFAYNLAPTKKPAQTNQFFSLTNCSFDTRYGEKYSSKKAFCDRMD